MALIQVTAVGLNGRLLPESQVLDLPLDFAKITADTKGVAGANSTVIIPAGPAGGGVVQYQVTETQEEILATANGAAPSLINRTAVAINATATMADGDMSKGLITSTSAAATSITLRTATQLATELGAKRGSTYEFVVDNTAGASTVTLVVGSGITAASDLTGGTDLTVSASATIGVGVFKLTFFSTTAAILSRIA